MGAWAAYAFADDTALDWLDGTFLSGGEPAVRAALQLVLSETAQTYLEYDASVEGRAAAEVVAVSFGVSRPDEDEEDIAKVAVHQEDLKKHPELKVKALRALERVSASNSEIHELWTEDETAAAEWANANSDLRARLS
ncbi:MAG: DUF4259 domain-containing protein [Pseudomonadota bacterium]